MTSNDLTYVLITPARNEEALIEQTIRAMIVQTRLPRKWVIVSDGSTDRTEEIVEKYLPKHPWIELVRLPTNSERHFAAKARSFAEGYEKVCHLSWDIVGNLDADITFGPDYCAYLLDQFALDPCLGVAGTPFLEGEAGYDFRYSSVDHVSGACQLFRRACYEQIGGYQAVRGGGIDWIAVTTARMKGWRTRTFTEQVCHHHRPMGTASAGRLTATFKLGQQDYYLGGSPLFQVFRGLYQMARKPYLIGGAALVAGYFWGWVSRHPIAVTPDLIHFHRQEQTQRLVNTLRQTVGLAGTRQAHI